MALFTGSKAKNTYKGILNISNDNTGLTGTLKTIQTSEGTDSKLQLSTTAVNIVSGLELGGTAITTSGVELNYSTGVTSAIQTQLDSKGTGTVDTSGTPVANDIARFTDADTIEGRSYTELKTDLSLNNVDNIADASQVAVGALDSGSITANFGVINNGASDILTTGSLGATGSRLLKGWFADLEVTNAIAASITGNAATVTNATLTTALTVNTGTLTLTANVANSSVLTIGAGASSISGANTGDQTNISGNAATVTVDATTTDTTCFPAIFESASGSLEPQTDAGLTYNANTNALTTTTFIGALTGNASTVSTITGLAPDTATTQATQGNITSLGTLTSLSSGAITSTGKFSTTLTTEQMRLNYDATNYAHFTVDIEGATTITTVDADAANANLIFSPDGIVTSTTNMTVNSNYVLEGYSTGRNVLRSIVLQFEPGATPNTNINITSQEGNSKGFNVPSFTDATNLAKSGTSGAFSLNAAGTLITMDLTEEAIGILQSNLGSQFVLNSASTTEIYIVSTDIVGGDLRFAVRKRGSTALVDWTTILDASDIVTVWITFVTST